MLRRRSRLIRRRGIADRAGDFGLRQHVILYPEFNYADFVGRRARGVSSVLWARCRLRQGERKNCLSRRSSMASTRTLFRSTPWAADEARRASECDAISVCRAILNTERDIAVISLPADRHGRSVRPGGETRRAVILPAEHVVRRITGKRGEIDRREGARGGQEQGSDQKGI